MYEPLSYGTTRDNSAREDGAAPSLRPNSANDTEEIVTIENQKAAAFPSGWYVPKRRRRKVRAYWRRLFKAGPDRHIELLIALIVVIFAGLQYANTLSSSRQMNNLIDAANQIKNAGWEFSGAAMGINKAGWSAVGKLNDQSTQLSRNVTQSSRLADETKVANSNVVAADRPWIGGTIQVTDFDVGKKPTITIVFTNSGKRPAVIDTSAERSGFYLAFPFNPDIQFVNEGAHSTDILVPGQSVTMPAIANAPLKQVELDLADGSHPVQTYFIFAKVDYRDLQTNESHYTHVCMFYIPRLKSSSDNGFRNCPEYNEAD